MRIDKSLLITGDNRADTGSMLSRLETGDVISAKVLEISPKEAVLRLTDGTVIKARTLEQLDVKPGQTISLTVTSRSDNSFVLETLKSISQAIAADSAKLFNMLEAAGIKPDDQNLKLAAEFLKYDTVPTSEMINAASESMKGPDGLDIEKAVYLAVKNINTAQSDKEMLSGLLGGDLKLGQLLDSLFRALNSESKSTKASQPAQEAFPDTEIKPAQQAEHSFSQVTDESMTDGQNTNTAPEFRNTGAKMDLAWEQNVSVSVKQNDGEDLGLAAQILGKDPDPAAKTFVLRDSDSKTDIKSINHKAELSSKPDTATNEDHSAIAARINTGRTADNTSKPDTEPDFKQIAKNTSKAKDIINKPIDLPTYLKNGYSPEEALQRISKSIDGLFVKIHKQLSGDELDPANIRDRISEISKELEMLMQAPDSSKAVDVKASMSLNLLEDTVKLLDMFNSNNVLYYQIPIKNDNYRSTAELYVMKRHKNRKKIDPNDLVLFLSLDTINLGRFETILDVKGRNISMSLRTENQAVSDFASANIKSLYTALSDSGYKLTDIKYSLIGAAATPLQQEKLLTDAVRLKHGRVDLRI